MTRLNYHTIFLDETVRDTSTTRRLQTAFPRAHLRVLPAGEQPSIRKALQGKNHLFVTRFQGEFVKPCPGQDDRYLCCGYHVINETTNCPLDCSYCFLQGYLTRGVTTVYANTGRIIAHLKNRLSAHHDRIFRVGTGELADSLALDPITRLSETLIPFFARQNQALLELKTKTAQVDHLLDLPHAQRTVIAWTLSPDPVTRTVERNSATLDERLQALAKVQQAHYPVALHFDPILHQPGWQDGYDDLFRRLGQVLDPSRVAWVSFGSFRFAETGGLDLYRRHTTSQVYLSEMISGTGGKRRYIKPIRHELYEKVVGTMRKRFPGLFYYFCMETPDIWERHLDRVPVSMEHLDQEFHDYLWPRFFR